ncbi:serine/threonine protein kinase [Bradymonas sediminis]|uniref:Protein kinase domain-containing protein n=1 Tax=Bradymonas sediminis TaxID=1548548 RepID=A0A2Z4FPJ4_9DELT|nr:serine/threonine-protein kinase [Bradymonas sediminis]AWV90971.1 hypothetical protein DN745_17215 [Bradymonas sediminis]TDP75290.1 serine/threonine-protein kinase [Bradymonas sediminis]
MAEQRYQVIERIDAGGMAEVFKANSTSLQGYQKLVAIKRVLPELTQNERFVRMFLDEAKVSLHLNHTNVVQVFDLGIADETYFIVMEYVDGSNLKKIIQLLGQKKQRLSVEQAVYIALQVCQGLAHAHALLDQRGAHLGIVHRDISPPNVLLSREGEVKITDFGLAKARDQAEVTDPGVVKGKFGYLSPEAATGENVDARTDLFAVGILLWEMIAGRRLFLGETDYKTLQLVREAKIPSLAQFGCRVPPRLEHILKRALARDPAQRYQSAKELGAHLARFLFEYGKVVSAFDIAHLVDNILEKKDERATAADVAAGKQVQRELNKLMSLEEMGNLDLLMTQRYGQITPDAEESGEYSGDGEDPREWMDLGFSGDDFVPSMDPAHNTPIPGGGGDKWQAGGLQDVARATQTMEAIKVPQEVRDAARSAMQRPSQPTPKQEEPPPQARPQPPAQPRRPEAQPAPAELPEVQPAQAPQHSFGALPQSPPSANTGEKTGGKAPLIIIVLLLLIIIGVAVVFMT